MLSKYFFIPIILIGSLFGEGGWSDYFEGIEEKFSYDAGGDVVDIEVDSIGRFYILSERDDSLKIDIFDSTGSIERTISGYMGDTPGLVRCISSYLIMARLCWSGESTRN